ncbi:MAG: SUMF1/EgtB/PvdO family nonheme iron enzyme [Planctomycetes bacterium]|nr:SUMF1/EgtB/PvdO family nonheme iron enzyme [Planctomycetota bacterium]
MSDGPREIDPEVLADFLDGYWSDRDAGRSYGLDHYLALFPNDREAIAREYELLETGQSPEPAEPTEPPTSVGPTLGGERIGRFRLVEVLGRGGQAIVWLAEDERLGRKVALKILRGIGAAAPEMVERFRREAALTAKIDHPGICPMHDVGFDGVPWIAMRYIPGRTVSEILREAKRSDDAGTTFAALITTGGITSSGSSGGSSSQSGSGSLETDQKKVLLMVERVARALHAAHQTGVVHRDIKPSNIKITPEGDPVVLDFGIAFQEDGDEATLTQTGDFLGTPAYMAPEQISGARVDRRTDVYALGVLLYECLSLRRPFEAPTREQLFHAILHDDAPSLREVRSDVSADIAVVVATTLQKDREHRYDSAEALADELRRVLERRPIHARPVGALTRTWRWALRNRGIAAATTVAFVLLVAALSASIHAWRAERDRARTEREQAAIERREAAAERARLAAVERANEALENEARLQREKTELLEREAEVAYRARQLADPLICSALEDEAEDLWPQRESTIPAIDSWLQRARALLTRLEKRAAELADLRTRALPLGPGDEKRQDDLRRELFPEEVAGLEAAQHAVAVWRRELENGELPASRRRLLERNIAGTEKNIEKGLAFGIFTDRLLFRFESTEDQELHDALFKVLRRRTGLEDLIERMEIRRSNAAKIRKMTLEQRKDAWDLCLADLRARHPGLELEPQEGLVPLGRDLHSGLWEFWVLETGAAPPWEGETTGGHAEQAEGMGMVLVLLPGGACRIGAQAEDATAANHDPLARGDESPVTLVDLDPFFIGKYEVSQIQWARLMNEVPARFSFESRLKTEFEVEQNGSRGFDRADLTPDSPVEYVTWEEADRFARRLGMRLPTEEQWEYAARAGTVTPWWTGPTRESLKGMVNLIDFAKDGQSAYDLADGHLIHVPCGSFPPNPFGLHEILGNVSEWTASTWGHYDVPPRAGDGYRLVEAGRSASRFRVHRGGSYDDGEALLRAARRGREPPDHRSPAIGLRLVRIPRQP